MTPPDIGRRALETEKPAKIRRAVSWEEQEETPGRGKRLVCRTCLKHITDESQRISVDGAHSHSFANPQGHIFDIGCFGSAEGWLGIGPASNEFTWFRGYSWRVVICAGCTAHLGWFFQSSGRHPFFGLILDRLVSSA